MRTYEQLLEQVKMYEKTMSTASIVVDGQLVDYCDAFPIAAERGTTIQELAAQSRAECKKVMDVWNRSVLARAAGSFVIGWDPMPPTPTAEELYKALYQLFAEQEESIKELSDKLSKATSKGDQ